MYWLDLVIIVAILIGIWQGFMRGFISQLFLVISVILAMVIAFWSFSSVGSWFEESLRIPLTYARPLALAIIFIVATIVLQIAASILQRLVAPFVKASLTNRIGGTALGGLRQLVNLSVILALLFTLPVPQVVKAAIDQSRLAKPLINFAFGLERRLGAYFGDDALRSLSYRIVGTDQTTTTALNFSVPDAQPNEADEAKLFALTNATRQQEGQPLLKPNLELRDVARAHAQDMLAKGYFSHISPEGEDALARVQKANIAVLAVGENLANAPSVEIAHAGLLASAGHRRNIVNAEFNEVGIGVLDAGRHGKMVVEVFAKRL